jgi:outer membrane receptor for ferrienterochelin and colicins
LRSSCHTAPAACLRFTARLIVFVLLAMPAIAQKQKTDLTDLSIEDLMNVEVYSASKHMQSASDAPASVTVVTADDIRRYGYRTLADILQSVRGFYVTYDRDYSFVGVRGFGRLGDWNSRILVLIDGHRINDNVLGNAMLGTEFLVDVDMIERIEIVRGPSSSLYGAQAFFAVINVITRKAPELKGLELAFTAASFGTYQGRASYGAEYKGVGLQLSGTFYNSQGPTLFFPVFDSPATNNGITSDTDFESFQHILATLSYHGFTLQGLYSSRDKGVPTGYYESLFNDPQTLNLDSHEYVSLSYQHSIDDWQLSARSSYDQAHLFGPVALATGVPSAPADLNTYSFREKWWDGEVQLSRTIFDKHKLTFGAEVTDNLRQDQGDYDAASNTFTADPRSSNIWALYAQDEFAITSKLALSAGLRYDQYSDFGGTTNPRLGLIYHVLPSTTMKVLYGTAFRAPEPFEFETDFGSFYEDNPDLKPETIRSVEGVVEQGIGEHFSISGNVFQNWIGNLITLETDPSNGLDVYRNSGNASATGVELELNARMPDQIEGTASYSFTHTAGGATEPALANSPEQLAKLNLSVPIWRRRLLGSVDAQYTSSRLTLAGPPVSGFAVCNVTLLAHALGKHADFSASIYNIFDKKYFDPGRPEDPENAIQQDGRNFRVKLTYRF